MDFVTPHVTMSKHITVITFHDFPITHILRQINFGNLRSPKYAIMISWDEILNFYRQIHFHTVSTFCQIFRPLCIGYVYFKQIQASDILVLNQQTHVHGDRKICTVETTVSSSRRSRRLFWLIQTLHLKRKSHVVTVKNLLFFWAGISPTLY